MNQSLPRGYLFALAKATSSDRRAVQSAEESEVEEPDTNVNR
jgi:hypothetical protein